MDFDCYSCRFFGHDSCRCFAECVEGERVDPDDYCALYDRAAPVPRRAVSGSLSRRARTDCRNTAALL